MIKLATFLDSKTKVIYLTLVIVYESKLKINVTSPWKFFQIMLTSVFIYKQNLLHENKIRQLLHNYKCYGVDQGRYRKPLQSSAKNVKSNYLKKAGSFLLAVQFVTSLNVYIVRAFASF